jgi:hypothetical protein
MRYKTHANTVKFNIIRCFVYSTPIYAMQCIRNKEKNKLFSDFKVEFSHESYRI